MCSTLHKLVIIHYFVLLENPLISIFVSKSWHLLNITIITKKKCLFKVAPPSHGKILRSQCLLPRLRMAEETISDLEGQLLHERSQTSFLTRKMELLKSEIELLKDEVGNGKIKNIEDSRSSDSSDKENDANNYTITDSVDNCKLLNDEVNQNELMKKEIDELKAKLKEFEHCSKSPVKSEDNNLKIPKVMSPNSEPLSKK